VSRLLLVLISEVYKLNHAVETLQMGSSHAFDESFGIVDQPEVPSTEEECLLTSLPPPPRPRAVSSSALYVKFLRLLLAKVVNRR
jgi:hypothetical protein